MIQRYLEQVSANPAEVDQLEFRNLIRRASEQGLLHSDLSAWMEHRRNRGLTSHVYNEAMAERVFQAAQDFLVEVRYLLRGLQERNERLD
jgi:nucleotidyltransferase substrate binding protein (TIGR01987 family)